jgi:hypothetical protein
MSIDQVLSGAKGPTSQTVFGRKAGLIVFKAFYTKDV